MRPDASLDIDSILEALEALNDGIAIYGPDDKPLYANGVTMKRFGRMYGDLTAGMTYPDATAAAVRRNLPDASEEQVAAFANYIIDSHRMGRTHTVASEDNRTVRVTVREMTHGRKAAISVDITDLRARECELDKARKAAEAASASKSAFLANMSHEIRTPLNGVLGMAQVLDTTRLDDTQRDYLGAIISSGGTLMALLNDVLDLSKIEAGHLAISPADTDLAHLLRRIVRIWEPRAREKGLDLVLSLDADLPNWVSFDAVRVQQCVVNLLSNAIKFTEMGRIEIIASAKTLPDGASMVEIRVADTGPGMEDEILARLFQPFVQADETISREHGGTGLGLSITRRLAELMGGTATATSDPGHGSTFTVTFRCNRATRQPDQRLVAAHDSAELRETLRASHLRVLLVDDHPINRQVARLFLRPFNISIVEAANGAEAITALETQTFDIVLLDMHMPVMDGPSTIASIRASKAPWSMIPVIALTADAMSGDKERYLGMGMNGYLSKPLAERDLLCEIARILGHASETPPLAKAG